MIIELVIIVSFAALSYALIGEHKRIEQESDDSLETAPLPEEGAGPRGPFDVYVYNTSRVYLVPVEYSETKCKAIKWIKREQTVRYVGENHAKLFF